MSVTTTRHRNRRERPRTSDGAGSERSRQSTGPRGADRLRERVGRRGIERALDGHDPSDRAAGRERAIERIADLLATEAGRPLPAATEREMAARFGHDFGEVRVHDGPAAARTAEALDATAYTVGSNIVFGEGFDPDRIDGRLLLAHELAHVVQQRGAAPTDVTSLLSYTENPAEREADRAVQAVLAGRSPTVTVVPGALLSRQEKRREEDLFGISKGLTGLSKSGFKFIVALDDALKAPDRFFSTIGASGEVGHRSGVDYVGPVFDAAGEVFGRLSEGEGLMSAFSAGSVRGLTGMGVRGMGEVAPGWAKGRSDVSKGAGIFSAVLKMAGGLAGEGTAGDWLTGIGTAVDYGGKIAAPVTLAQQATTEGVMSLYNTLLAGGESYFTGEISPMQDLYERNLSGKSGDIVQGYAFLGEGLESLISGDTSNLEKLGNLADEGELGILPEFGSWLGGMTYDTVETGRGLIERLSKEGIDSGRAIEVASHLPFIGPAAPGGLMRLITRGEQERIAAERRRAASVGASVAAMIPALVGGSAGAAGPHRANVVSGAGRRGVASGRGTDEDVGGPNDWSWTSDWFDEQRGITRGEGQHGDYSLSETGSSIMQAQDRSFTGAMRSIGVYDESRPEYAQTLGWKLAEVLPSWMQ